MIPHFEYKHTGHQKTALKTACAAMKIRSKMSTVEGLLEYLISLPILLLRAIIAIAIIAEQFG